MTPQCDIFLIDGFSLLYRAYYGYPPNLTSPSGGPINAVYGFVTLMMNAIEQFKPTHVAVCMDRKEPTYRHQLFPDYKAHRSAPDDEFLAQLPDFRLVMESFGIPLIELPGYESDDLLGTLSECFSKMEKKTFIMSGDLDLFQLINDHTHIVTSTKGSLQICDDSAVFERFQLAPSQIIDFKALKGDASDNIPGVKGIGDKTAVKLLSAYHSLDGIYDHLDDLSSASVALKLSSNKDMAYLSKQLVTIDCNAPIDCPLESIAFNPDWQKVRAIFDAYEFKRLLSRLPNTHDDSAATISDDSTQPRFKETAHSIIRSMPDLHHLLPLLKLGFAFDLETTALDPQDARIVAIAITASTGISFVIDCTMPDTTSDLFGFSDQRDRHPLLQALVPLFEDEHIPKIMHNAKFEVSVLHYYGIQLTGIHFDTMIAAHLIDSRQAVGLKSLALSVFDYQMLDFETLIKPYDSILDVPFDDLATYAADDSNVTFQLYEYYKSAFTNQPLELFTTIEMPLVCVLAEMEVVGVQCDTQYLGALSLSYTQELNRLEGLIYSMAGRQDFNINSTKQLAGVLFDELKLPVVKQTKTSRSTDSSVLETLAKSHPIAKELLNYRLYKKLLSTYIDRLPQLVHPMSQKIHASFNQAVTATGRLSSTEPNLQNIPVRSEAGQKIRCAFISRFKDGVIVAIDYSQIELRVLAHLSNDRAMIQAFNEGQDIHQATAAMVFQVPYSDVTKPQREQAKTVNFGITYGQSAFALSEQLSISRKEAQLLIDHYFKQFDSIQTFMKATIQQAQADGLVSTMFGRTRVIDGIDSSNRSVQGMAQRMAINTRVQGSAADIIKLAMNHAHQALIGCQSKMILQVHDELVFDIHPNEAKTLIPLLATAMAGAVSLQVPLVVDVEAGPSWGDIKPMD